MKECPDNTSIRWAVFLTHLMCRSVPVHRAALGIAPALCPVFTASYSTLSRCVKVLQCEGNWACSLCKYLHYLKPKPVLLYPVRVLYACVEWVWVLVYVFRVLPPRSLLSQYNMCVMGSWGHPFAPYH